MVLPLEAVDVCPAAAAGAPVVRPALVVLPLGTVVLSPAAEFSVTALLDPAEDLVVVEPAAGASVPFEKLLLVVRPVRPADLVVAVLEDASRFAAATSNRSTSLSSRLLSSMLRLRRDT